jgi:diguanylate cyclase (GGDEF)-like protein
MHDSTLMLCMRDILDSKGQGPIAGTLVVARTFDGNNVSRLSEQLRVDLRLGELTEQHPLSEENLAVALPKNLLRNVYIDASTEGMYQVSLSLVDLAGGDVASLLLRWPREINSYGQTVLQQVRVQRWISGLVLLIVLLLLVDWLVVQPLRRFRDQIVDVTGGAIWSARLDVAGHDEIEEVARSTNRLLGVIENQVHALREQSHTDALTGLPNRRAFDEQLVKALARSRRDGRPVSVILLDIDHFKAYNDQLGHPEGDVALRAFAGVMRDAVRRPGDLPARHGGEEFAVLLEDTDLEGAEECAASILRKLTDLNLMHPSNPPWGCITCSAGVAQSRPDEPAHELIRRADVALYSAKTNGRNQVQRDALN